SPLATSCSVDSYLGLVLLAKATSSHVSVLSLQKAIAFSISTTVVLTLLDTRYDRQPRLFHVVQHRLLGPSQIPGLEAFENGPVFLQRLFHPPRLGNGPITKPANLVSVCFD